VFKLSDEVIELLEKVVETKEFLAESLQSQLNATFDELLSGVKTS
jgi:hypothetical protein